MLQTNLLEIAAFKCLYFGRHKNNPEVGMLTLATDANDRKAVWQHDPHLDPSLSRTGKAERLSFEVDTVSLHVRERIDPGSILAAGDNRKVAVKIVGDRRIVSLKIVNLEDSSC